MIKQGEIAWRMSKLSLPAALGSVFEAADGGAAGVPEDTEVVAVYFSASWCGPCRTFTPKLAEYYVKSLAAGRKIEIVYASMDRDADAFREYRAKMPWLAIPYGDPRHRGVASHFSVYGIPKLVMIDAATGKTITGDGRGAVLSDPEGEQFPYREWKGSGSWCTTM